MNIPIRLVTRAQQHNEDTVAILEDFLRMAKSGEIIAVAVVGLEPSGASQSQSSATDKIVTLIGAVSRLLHRMHINADEVVTVGPPAA